MSGGLALERDLDNLIAAGAPNGQTSIKRNDRELLEEILSWVRGLRIAPDEESILKAIASLTFQARLELEYLEEQQRDVVQKGARSNLDFAVINVREKLSALEAATLVLRSPSLGSSNASAVLISGLGSLLDAAHEAEQILNVREYKLEQQGDWTSSLYQGVQRELQLLKKAEEYLIKLNAENREMRAPN